MTTQLFQVVSFEVARAALRRDVKQRIRTGLPDHELARFILREEEFEQMEFEDGGREFRSGGHLYDLVRCTKNPDGTVHLMALDDADETGLLVGLDEMLRIGLEERGLGRDRARALIAFLPCSMPVPPLRIRSAQACDARMFPERGAALREFVPQGPLRPPRS